MFKKFVTIAILATSLNASADQVLNNVEQIECRTAIVNAYSTLQIKIDPNSFSTHTFEDYNLSIEEFNALAPELQEAIYQKIKPISVVVESTINYLNRYINRYAGTIYEQYLIDDLQNWRHARDVLRNCK